MSDKSKRLAKNTLTLTIRMLFLMAVNLYTSRILLEALGIEDYGIYNVVGGVVTMFSIISSSITAAISRFITFELGTDNKERLSKVFSSAVIIQSILAFIIFVLIETAGLWFLRSEMNIPDNRMVAANWVFQFSILTFVINLISIPYNAAIIAHEKMNAFAYISIYEGIGKLVIAYAILVSPIDTLIFYGLSICLLSISVRFIYTIYCKRKFAECTLHWIWERSLLKEMFGFAGWNFIGAASGILRDQGGNIIINIFCGPTVNAARGIASQVSNAVHNFISGFTTAMNPQITKSYASEDKTYMMSLLYKGSKFSYYILFVLSLPLLFNTSYVVQLWLGQIPEHSINFIRLILILSMSESISNPLITAMLATGNIKKYQIIVGGINLLNLPVSYVLLRLGFLPESVFVTAIVLSQLCLWARLVLLKPMIKFDARRFILEVYLRILLVSAVSFIIPYITYTFLSNDITRFIITSLVSVSCSMLTIWVLGLSKMERSSIRKSIHQIIGRIINH
ncbi:lipopolysaccharide biosynthesis protein [uncultured Odoribacter sp.]|uniref:lipopolysaccharide biosynthesis protein n=1 Tax=uncultured Odoribacter sp. TaxID=876416 RepID=UPI00261B33ED|nr:lipopolysaccharide biosynthesis protein [uncultured Odoribacter sp.]